MMRERKRENFHTKLKTQFHAQGKKNRKNLQNVFSSHACVVFVDILSGVAIIRVVVACLSSNNKKNCNESKEEGKFSGKIPTL
jgi:hypothetical protein